MTTGLTNRCSQIWAEHLSSPVCSQVSWAQCTDMTAHTASSSQHQQRLHTNKPCHQDQAGRRITYFGDASCIPFYEKPSSTVGFAFCPLSILAAELRYSAPCDRPHSFTWERLSLCPFTRWYFYPAALDSQPPCTMSSLMGTNHF